MAIKLPQGFEILSKAPIDTRLVLTKEQMRDDTGTLKKVMPEKYFAVCKDNGQFYVYDKAGEYTAETGFFHPIGLKLDPGQEGQVLLFTNNEWVPVDFTDENSVIYLANEGLSIKGFKEARTGQIITKSDNVLEWVDPFNVLPGEENKILLFKNGKWNFIDFVDEISISYLENQGITLKDYASALQGQMPVKGEEKIEWVDPFNLLPGEEGQILIFKSGKWTPSKFTDENSIIYLNEDGGLSIKGYSDARQGQMLVKDDVLGLTWTNPVSDAQLQQAVATATAQAQQAGNYANQAGNSAVDANNSARTAQRINEQTMKFVNDKFWWGTIGEYNQLEEINEETFYFVQL